MITETEIIFFKTPAEFRKWLEKNHEKKTEVWVGYYKVNSGKPSITWPESVDQALCFGWIDGLRKGIDEASYKIRFTPRKKTSIWSAINLKRIEELSQMGLVMPAGKKIHGERKEQNAGRYSFEQKEAIRLDPAYEKKFKANKKAWKWFSAQAPSYIKTASWWVMSAKQEATKLKRLHILISDSETGKKIAPLSYNGKKK